MKQKERKAFNKQVKQEAILSVAKELILEGGIEAFTMRKTAQRIGYSPCIIYEHFTDKKEILNALFKEVCLEVIRVLGEVEQKDNAEAYLIALYFKNIEFLLEKPFRLQIFVAVVGGLSREEFPPEMREVSSYFGNALKNLNYRSLSNQKEIDIALEILRALQSGVLNVAVRGGSLDSYNRSLKTMENALQVLLDGWKSR